MIAPPYTSDFVQLFLPILENDSIAGTIKTEGEHDPVTEFIGMCSSAATLSVIHFRFLTRCLSAFCYSSLQV